MVTILAKLATGTVIIFGAGIATSAAPAWVTHTGAVAPNIVTASTVLAAIRALFTIWAKVAIGTIVAKIAGKAFLTDTFAAGIDAGERAAMLAAIGHRVAI